MDIIQKIVLGLWALLSGTGLSTLPLPTPAPTYTAQSLPQAIATLQKETGDQLLYTVDETNGVLRYLATIGGVALPIHIASPEGDTPEMIARRFLTEYGYLFGVTNQAKNLLFLKVLSDNPETFEETHSQSLQFRSFDPTLFHTVRFQQVHETIPIHGAQVVVLIRALDNGVMSIHSSFIPSTLVSTTPTISSDQAVQLAKIWWQTTYSENGDLVDSPNLFIIKPDTIDPTKGNESILTWRVEMSNTNPNNSPQRRYVYIDAETGAILATLPIHFSVLSRKIYDCKTGPTCINWSKKVARNEGSFATGDQQVDNLYSYMGKTYDYFYHNHQRNGANGIGGTGNGFSIVFPVNPDKSATLFDQTYGFANVRGLLIDFQKVSSYADLNSIYMMAGQTTLDVVAHEYTHIVTMNSANLTYSYQSGALNEAFSDIFAVLVDDRDWLLSFEDGKPLRDVSDPLRSKSPPWGQPDRLFNSKYACVTFDEGGVHINSGIINKAAYLISEGGNFNVCSVEGIGREKMGKIFYGALTRCLTPSSNFRDAYDCLTQICLRMYGAGTPECDATFKALQAVEIDQQPAGDQWGASCPEYFLGPPRLSPKAPTCSAPPGLPTTPPLFRPTRTPTPRLVRSPTPTRRPIPTTPRCNSGNCYNDCICSGGTSQLCYQQCTTLPPQRSATPTRYRSPTFTPSQPILTPTPSTYRPPTSTPASWASCRPMYGIQITSTNGSNLGSTVFRGQDFLCKVTTDRVNYSTSCGLSVNGGWTLTICRNSAGYGYQYWSGNTVVFKCNTKCANDVNCQTESIPFGASYQLVGMDFSPQCGPYSSTSVRKPITLQ